MLAIQLYSVICHIIILILLMFNQNSTLHKKYLHKGLVILTIFVDIYKKYSIFEVYSLYIHRFPEIFTVESSCCWCCALMCRETGGHTRAWEERGCLHTRSQPLLHGADQAATQPVSNLNAEMGLFFVLWSWCSNQLNSLWTLIIWPCMMVCVFP